MNPAGHDEPVGVRVDDVVTRGETFGAGFEIFGRWFGDIARVWREQRQPDGPVLAAFIHQKVALSSRHEAKR